MRDGDRALLQTRDRHRHFPRRAGRIAATDRAVVERLLRIAQQRGIFGAAFFRVDALREEVRIKGRVRSHRKDFAVVRIHRHDHAAPRRRVAQLFFGRLLQVEINRRHDVLAGLRRHALDLFLNPPARINDHFAVAVAPAQDVVIDGFEALLPDDVAGFQALVFVLSRLKLLRIDLADVAEHVREQPVLRITTLRLLLDAQGGELRAVCFDPSDIGLGRVLLNRDGLERRLRFDLIEPLAQDVCVNTQAICERRDECAEVLPL